MTPESKSRLRIAKHRAMALLLSIEVYGPEADDPQFPARTRSVLREVARLCMAEAWHLDQLKEENMDCPDEAFPLYTADESRPANRFNINDIGPANRGAEHHIENAVTSLCAALQFARNLDEASRIISALTVAVAARFRAGEKR